MTVPPKHIGRLMRPGLLWVKFKNSVMLLSVCCFKTMQFFGYITSIKIKKRDTYNNRLCESGDTNQV